MTDFTSIDTDALEGATGGSFSSRFGELAKGGFGLRTLYRGAVKELTADAGGWQLANQMYGTPEHGASFSEKLRARGALKEYLNGSDRLPSWAPQW